MLDKQFLKFRSAILLLLLSPKYPHLQLCFEPPILPYVIAGYLSTLVSFGTWKKGDGQILFRISFFGDHF